MASRRRSTYSDVSQQWMKKDARKAAQDAAALAGKGLLLARGPLRISPKNQGRSKGDSSAQDPATSPDGLSQDMWVESSNDASSVSSIVRAVHRGSHHGYGELNERVSFFPDEHSLLDMDLTSITDDGMTNLTPATVPYEKKTTKKKKKRVRIARKIFKKKSGSSSLSSRSSSMRRFRRKNRLDSATNSSMLRAGQITRDAWMCGCCGKAYSTFKAAETHENICIRETIIKLELAEASANPLWMTTPKVATPAAGATRTSILRAPTDPFPSWMSPSTRALLNSSRTSALRLADHDAIAPAAAPGLDTTGPDDPLPSLREKGLGLTDSSEFYSDPQGGVGSNGVDNTALVPDAARRSSLRKAAPTNVAVDGYHPYFNHISEDEDSADLLLTATMREYLFLTDEALVNTVCKAQALMLTYEENDAERDLALLVRDISFYEMLATRTEKRNAYNHIRYHTHKKGVLPKIRNKFAEAYEIIKEGDTKENADQYSRKVKGNEPSVEIAHNDSTLYVNVMVKNSISVVNNELERLAKIRWEDNPEKRSDTTFEQFRAMAQANIVKLAGLALSSDFTPRRIAVQLSNDLYRLMGPRLTKRGVTIETEIEYRVGPYFVLAVNIQKIDWTKVMKYTRRDVLRRKRLWSEQNEQKRRRQSTSLITSISEEYEKPKGKLMALGRYMYQLSQMSRYEILAQFLAWLYHVHWFISIPICSICYRLIIPSTMRTYFLTSVTDEIFQYIEEKGMEMEIQVTVARVQAAFMLSALRELRSESRDQKRKEEETKTTEKGVILGPLLGPAIKADKGPAQPPPDFVPPENLEFIGLEIDLPVGFRRLRWALLNSKSEFIVRAVFEQEAQYKDVVLEDWSHHNDEIGLPVLPDGVSGDNFIGAEAESNYLMPKSAFVNANTCFETVIITMYTDYCFCIKKKARTPDVPFGSTFVAWTQIVVTNTGNDTCHMVCSTEAEFPNGPPMASRQIKSGMRAGTAELFVMIGEAVCKYADEYP